MTGAYTPDPERGPGWRTLVAWAAAGFLGTIAAAFIAAPGLIIAIIAAALGIGS